MLGQKNISDNLASGIWVIASCNWIFWVSQLGTFCAIEMADAHPD